MAADPERIAVIVGVGQVNDRPADPMRGLDSLGLMVAALEAADRDAGGDWLGDVESVAVVQQISFRQDNPLAHKVADGIGSRARIVYESAGPNGDSPILLLNEAANRIARGEIRIAAVTGGEALRTASQRAALAAKTAVADQNPIRNLAKGRSPGYRQVYGLSAPVDVYPLYENAGRAAYGQTLAEGQRESGEIWSRFSRVANETPAAWIHAPKTPDEVIEPTADNRPIAFPYTKLMVANSSVNQGAGFIVTSLAEARRRGVPEARVVHVGRGASAHEADDFMARDRYDKSPSMEVCLERTLEWNAVTAGDLDLAELYSCFPCVPKMARRVIGWPLDKPATVFGGLTFGGGPIGNYMSHAVAEMVDALRAGAGKKGLLFANGGYATHNHAIVLGMEPLPGAGEAHEFDCQAEADAARGRVPALVKDYAGPAEIETYTVFYARDGQPRSGVVVARLPDGNRTLAQVPGDDAATIAFLTDGAAEPVGTKGEVVAAGDMKVWRRA
ncbi:MULTISPECIES: acetyl-CoA acetyltransferase [unclassified Sphingomonas]|uniref:acetyl-CoA acetyltransferase n=1 Tax=unclassified Sphingomonas TaxID=196159 RepID=UPI000927336B|nr:MULTISPECIES: acetyl-CoA acetyltransferase [unclassified Sphingomonas]MBN8849154.1 acetyl-CoA acetyltransferase [Sphingomonas sp.]OJV31203.1 MAG: acetyl-CoA acetyltransferase [Sphingomonas sp. 67-36]